METYYVEVSHGRTVERWGPLFPRAGAERVADAALHVMRCPVRVVDRRGTVVYDRTRLNDLGDGALAAMPQAELVRLGVNV